MKKWIIWTVVATILFAVVVHLATVVTMPYIIMNAAMSRFPSAPNQLGSFPPPTAASKTIPLPSPDIAYSWCKYNVSKNALRLKLVIPDSYWSIAFNRDNTDNYYTMNDHQVPSKNVEFLLVNKDVKVQNPGNAIVVTSPSDRGLILIRMIVPSPEKMPELVKIASQATATVEPPQGGKPVEQPAPKPEEMAMAEYTNAQYGFSIKYPKDWQQTDYPGTIFYARGTAPIPTLSVALVGGPSFTDAVIAQLSKSGTDIKVGAEKEVTLKDGTRASASKADWTVRGYTGESYVVGVRKGDKWFVVTVTTIGMFFPYDEDEFAEVAHTIEFKK
jgi:uncharacterized membrane protein